MKATYTEVGLLGMDAGDLLPTFCDTLREEGGLRAPAEVICRRSMAISDTKDQARFHGVVLLQGLTRS